MDTWSDLENILVNIMQSGSKMATNMVNLAQTTYHSSMGTMRSQRTDLEIRDLNVVQVKLK